MHRQFSFFVLQLLQGASQQNTNSLVVWEIKKSFWITELSKYCCLTTIRIHENVPKPVLFHSSKSYHRFQQWCHLNYAWLLCWWLPSSLPLKLREKKVKRLYSFYSKSMCLWTRHPSLQIQFKIIYFATDFIWINFCFA